MESGFVNANKADSQDICFVPDGDYVGFIKGYNGKEYSKGLFMHKDGFSFGEHKGIVNYTIGQRKGLGLSGGPWYVVKKNIRDNVIYVSNGYNTEKQYGNSIHINQMHFISGNPWRDDENDMKITFKNRHTPEFFNATLHRINEDEYLIESERKVQGIAPGQFGVIYSPDSKICYGSGIITGQSFT